MKLKTAWLPRAVKPARPGWYEVSGYSRIGSVRRHWNGTGWSQGCFANDADSWSKKCERSRIRYPKLASTHWRGLTEPHHAE